MRLLLLFALALPAFPQLTIYTLSATGVETATEALVDVGSTPAGDLLDTRFRLRNLGTTPINLTTLRVQGVGFSLVGNPGLPYMMAAGTNVDFRVRFLPTATGSFSATLQANNQSVILRGVALPAPRLYMDRDGTLQVVTTDQTVDFGRIERGQTFARRFLLRNEGATPFTTRSISITGSGFTLRNLPALPVTLNAGESATFDLSVTPTRSGIVSGTLDVDGRQFRIDVTVTDPPLPDITLVLPTQPLQSAQQAKLNVQLAAASPLTTTATLTIIFTPLAGAPDDPAIQIVGATRTANLTITEGDTMAKLANQTDITFQTGTTAGTLTFRVVSGLKSKEGSLTIGQAPLRVDSVKAVRNGTNLEVTATGFDNARSAGQAAFTFYDRSGRAINADPIRATITDVFTQFFRTSGGGGLFALKAVFPVAGDATQVGSVDVQVTNTLGGNTTRGTF